MSYYIHAAKFFLKNTTENGGYLEVTDDGKFGEFIPTDTQHQRARLLITTANGLLQVWSTPTFMVCWIMT